MAEDKIKQVKSRQRVINHGEVFTAEREVKAMCDLVNSECLNIKSRFLEPACGEGNFLIEILTRKLDSITDCCELNSIIALSSLYGIDILLDNVKICRDRLFHTWEDFIDSPELNQTAKSILLNNIVCGDSLTMKFLDGNYIIFPEWNFDGEIVTRKDFILPELMTIFHDVPIKEYQPVNFRRIQTL